VRMTGTMTLHAFIVDGEEASEIHDRRRMVALELVAKGEPTHGSAPKYAGRGVASPIAAIAALGLLLEEIAEIAAAGVIERAVGGLLSSCVVRSVDARSNQRTAEVGDLVANAVSRVPLD
jgi:isocitrate/isopropylmalate dehydrogenase